MSDSVPIPAAEFTDALEELDREAFAGFVGRLWAETADEIAVEPPLVTVREGDARTTYLVEPDESDTAAAVDATVHRDDSEVATDSAATAAGTEPSVVTPADLRNRLLYALSPATAEAVATDVLGVPARSPSYVDHAETAGDTDGDEQASAGKRDPTDGGNAPAAATSGLSGTSQHRSTAADASLPGRPPNQDRISTPSGGDRSDPAAESRNPGPSDWIDSRLAVVAVAALLVLAVTGGVVYAAEVSPDGDAGTFGSSTSAAADGVPTSGIHPQSTDPADSNGSVTATPMPGDNHPTGDVATNLSEAERSVNLEPTCTRSSLHVVQIQMNALKYNDNETNDGIRTVRRFASPQDRQSINTLERFIAAVKSPAYRPMLTYDSAEYTPVQISDDYAQVTVVTRENGNVTGRYDFRQRKIEQGQYEGCWMTDGVVALPTQE